jgi:hypothetical protein
MPRSKENKINKPIEYTQTKPVQVQVKQPGFFSNVFQGFAWSTGSTIARNMFESKSDMTPHSYSNITPSSSNQINCLEYKLCEKLNDPQECFNKMNVSEYTVCKKLFLQN